MNLLYSPLVKILLFSIISVYCQAQSDFVLKFGLSYNNFIDQLNQDRFSPVLGFLGGFAFESRLNEGMDFRAEFIWEQKGSYTDLTDQVIKLNYVSTYMGPKFNIFSENVSISLGLNFGVLVNRNVETEFVQNEAYEFNQIDFGPWVGLCHESYTSSGKISLEIRFFRGLVNINDSNSRFPLSAASQWTHNQNLQIGLGYAFDNRN